VRWREEIEELHAFFEAYFLGALASLDRADAALAPDFTMCGPYGTVSNRSDTMAALLAGHAHTTSLVITTSEHRLLATSGDLVVASYVEHHQLSDRSNQRHTTVVFEQASSAPNGLKWLRVHETWVASS
jgi:hypothetical protein